jgi:hypothetical protein
VALGTGDTIRLKHSKETLKNGRRAHFQHAKRKCDFRFASFSATYVAENGGASCPAWEALINQRFPNGPATPGRFERARVEQPV